MPLETACDKAKHARDRKNSTDHGAQCHNWQTDRRSRWQGMQDENARGTTDDAGRREMKPGALPRPVFYKRGVAD